LLDQSTTGFDALGHTARHHRAAAASGRADELIE
jgi:hypothetical protein